MISLRSDLRVEELDGEVVVLDRSGAVAHRLTGDAVDALHLLVDGTDPADVPDGLVDAVDELVRAGLVDDASGWSRRRFVALGGAGLAAASVSTFLLASPAAAASSCPDGVVPSPGQVKYDEPGIFTYTTGPGVTSLSILAWGGGGGGGAGGSEFSGGGGGGGHFVANPEVAVTACTEYEVTVGSGGDGGSGEGEDDPKSTDGAFSGFGGIISADGGNRGIGGSEANSGGAAPGGAATVEADGTGWGIWNAGGKGGDGLQSSNASGGGGGGGGGPETSGDPGGNGVDSGYGEGGLGGQGPPSGGAGGHGAPASFDGMPGAARGGGGGGGGIYQVTGAHPEGRAGNGGDGGPGAVWIGI